MSARVSEKRNIPCSNGSARGQWNTMMQIESPHFAPNEAALHVRQRKHITFTPHISLSIQPVCQRNQERVPDLFAR